MDNDWKNNTTENPFWRSKVSVEVMFLNGRTRVFGCPKCSKGWHKFVRQWREVKNEQAPS